MQTIQQILENTLTQRQTTGRVTLSPESNLTEQDAFNWLGKAYVSQVQYRGVQYEKNSEIHKAVELASKWLISPNAKRWLLIIGSVGTGKTTLANAVCDVLNAINKATKDGVWATPVEKISAIRLSQLARTDETKLQSIKKSLRLFIDDLGTETDNVKVFGNTISPITETIFDRYDSTQSVTIITSNLNTEQIVQNYGDRVADRLKEMCNKIVINTKSFRK